MLTRALNFFGLQTTAPPQITSGEKAYGWILSPTLDMLFCCGGFIWILYALYLIGGKPDPYAGLIAASLWWVSKIGLVTFSYGHQPATIWRVYLSDPTRKSVGNIVTIWAGVTIAVFGLAMMIPGAAVVFVKLILWWQIQHVLMQSYGVALIYCYKRGYFMNKFEKDTFYWLTNAAIAFFIIRSCTIKQCGTVNLYGLTIPFWGPLPMWLYWTGAAVLAALTATFVWNVFAKYKRDGVLFPIPALCNVLTGLGIYCVTDASFGGAFALFTIAYYHGAQYMVVTSSYYLKERGLPEGVPATKISSLLGTKAMLKYFGIIIVAGFLVSDTLPRCLSTMGISAAVTYAAVYGAVNFHHYFTDALIWKLKDPAVRKLLVA